MVAGGCVVYERCEQVIRLHDASAYLPSGRWSSGYGGGDTAAESATLGSDQRLALLLGTQGWRRFAWLEPLSVLKDDLLSVVQRNRLLRLFALGTHEREVVVPLFAGVGGMEKMGLRFAAMPNAANVAAVAEAVEDEAVMEERAARAEIDQDAPLGGNDAADMEEAEVPPRIAEGDEPLVRALAGAWRHASMHAHTLTHTLTLTLTFCSRVP